MIFNQVIAGHCINCGAETLPLQTTVARCAECNDYDLHVYVMNEYVCAFRGHHFYVAASDEQPTDCEVCHGMLDQRAASVPARDFQIRNTV